MIVYLVSKITYDGELQLVEVCDSREEVTQFLVAHGNNMQLVVTPQYIGGTEI